MNEAQRVACWMSEAAGSTVVFTGAGMSTASGLPDFRSPQGLWKGQDPTRIASVSAMRHNREEFLAFYRHRLEGLAHARPNRGHEILADWEKRGLLQGVITQNIDGFHRDAGSRNVAELHGRLAEIRCDSCRSYFEKDVFMERGDCPECGGFLRPGVVLFGEMLPGGALDQGEEWANACGLFVVLGSSLAVSPANAFPRVAKAAGAKLAICNREPTPLDGLADCVVHESIEEFLSCVDETF